MSTSLSSSTLTKKLAEAIEHTILSGDIDDARIRAHVQEAIDLNVFGVCLPLAWVPLAKKLLAGTDKKVITVIDFPLGQKSAQEKALEAEAAERLGADEIDMVLDYEALRKKDYHKALADLVAVVERVAVPIKVIVETSALKREELSIACALVALSGARFIKTSTGFHKAGAQVEDIKLMKTLLPDKVLIKASGGIKDFGLAKALMDAGASRIGCSKSKDILQGYA